MKHFLAAAFVIASSMHSSAQTFNTTKADTAYNLGFENVSPGKLLPDKWVKFNLARGYNCVAVSDVKHSGERALLMEQTPAASEHDFASIVNIIPSKFEGKKIEFKAYLKFEAVSDFVALMIRIDNANHKTVMFKSMQPQKIKGTQDWQLYSISAQIPADGQTIFVAPILSGSGKLWVDDAQLLIDGKDISEAKLNPAYNPHPSVKPNYGDSTSVSGRVKLKDASLYYETYGNGQPLLLLHGNSQSIYAFNYQIAELSKKYKVIAVDTRGQGKSTDKTTGALSYDLFADDMKQLLDSLHIKKTNILGWSDGGNTGIIMAAKYPRYVNKLAVMGANLFPTTEALPDTVLNEIKKGLAVYQTKTDALSKMEARLFTMLLNEPHLTFADIEKIKSPVLVMAGQHDLILDKHTRAIAATIQKSKLMIFKGLTHYAPVENPAVFNAAVLDFFGH